MIFFKKNVESMSQLFEIKFNKLFLIIFHIYVFSRNHYKISFTVNLISIVKSYLKNKWIFKLQNRDFITI